jgi:hypothetical protein
VLEAVAERLIVFVLKTKVHKVHRGFEPHQLLMLNKITEYFFNCFRAHYVGLTLKIYLKLTEKLLNTSGLKKRYKIFNPDSFSWSSSSGQFLHGVLNFLVLPETYIIFYILYLLLFTDGCFSKILKQFSLLLILLFSLVLCQALPTWILSDLIHLSTKFLTFWAFCCIVASVVISQVCEKFNRPTWRLRLKAHFLTNGQVFTMKFLRVSYKAILSVL